MGPTLLGEIRDEAVLLNRARRTRFIWLSALRYPGFKVRGSQFVGALPGLATGSDSAQRPRISTSRPCPELLKNGQARAFLRYMFTPACGGQWFSSDLSATSPTSEQNRPTNPQTARIGPPRPSPFTWPRGVFGCFSTRGLELYCLVVLPGPYRTKARRGRLCRVSAGLRSNLN